MSEKKITEPFVSLDRDIHDGSREEIARVQAMLDAELANRKQ